ncbi:MAG: GIY-YIG nuclease family protein [Porcipelethomonas sp.]
MFIYILRCEDNSLYTGITSDINKRIRQHLGKLKNGAKYTRSHPVVFIEAIWEDKSGNLARKTEYALKKLSRSAKEELIKNPHELSADLEYICPDKYNRYFEFYK